MRATCGVQPQAWARSAEKLAGPRRAVVPDRLDAEGAGDGAEVVARWCAGPAATLTAVQPPSTGPCSGSVDVGDPAGGQVGGEGGEVVDVHPREGLRRARRAGPTRRRGSPAGRSVFQTEVSPAPRIAGGRSSTRVRPSTSAERDVGVALGDGVVVAVVAHQRRRLVDVARLRGAVVDGGGRDVHEPGDPGVAGGAGEHRGALARRSAAWVSRSLPIGCTVVTTASAPATTVGREVRVEELADVLLDAVQGGAVPARRTTARTVAPRSTSASHGAGADEAVGTGDDDDGGRGTRWMSVMPSTLARRCRGQDGAGHLAERDPAAQRAGGGDPQRDGVAVLEEGALRPPPGTAPCRPSSARGASRAGRGSSPD